MNTQSNREVIEVLRKADFDLPAEARTFVAYRLIGGHYKHVEITVIDRGPSEPSRFRATAITETGQMATGNWETSLEAAILSVRWDDQLTCDHDV